MGTARFICAVIVSLATSACGYKADPFYSGPKSEEPSEEVMESRQPKGSIYGEQEDKVDETKDDNQQK